jgi:hypothetical protein
MVSHKISTSMRIHKQKETKVDQLKPKHLDSNTLKAKRLNVPNNNNKFVFRVHIVLSVLTAESST